jgi:hypothetical protein
MIVFQDFMPSVLDVAFPCFNYNLDLNVEWHNADEKSIQFNLFDERCYQQYNINTDNDTLFWRKVGSV